MAESMADRGRMFIESLGRTEADFDEYENRIICECGHEEDHHKWNPDDPLHVPWRQYTSSGKSYWNRYCRGHHGYDSARGHVDCRCTGYRPIKAGLHMYTRTGR